MRQVVRLIYFVLDATCTLVSTALAAVLTGTVVCFVASAADEALQSDLESPMLHFLPQSLPCVGQQGCGQLAGPPGQHAASDDAVVAGCIWAFADAQAALVIGQGLQPPVPGVHLPPPASSALTAPSASTNASTRATEKRNLFKIYSLNKVLRF